MASQAWTAVLVVGCVLAPLSLLVTITGVLELLVILGPISCGCISIPTWWSHNALLLALWLPTLGVAGWVLNAGWTSAVPFVALGSFFIVVHMLMLFCYWLRKVLRKQQAKELPTQELLSEAQRVLMAGPNEMAASGRMMQSHSHGIHDASDQFHLQVGRTDGAVGYTLYIPGEAEEAVLQEVAVRHYQKRLAAAQPTLPPSTMESGLRSSAQSMHSMTVRDSNSGIGGLLPSKNTSPQRQSDHSQGPLTASNSSRSLRASGSPDKDGPGSGRQGPAHRGVIQVLLPDALARWNQNRAPNRYRMLTDSALPSPAGGPPTSTGTKADAVAAVPRLEREFPFGHGGGEDPRRVVGGPADSQDGAQLMAVQGSGLSGNMLEASNPLFGSEASLAHELSLRQSQAMSSDGPSGDWATPSATLPPPPSAAASPTLGSVGSAGQQQPPQRVWSRGVPGASASSMSSMSRRSMDPVLLSPALLRPSHGPTLSSDHGSPWMSQLHHLQQQPSHQQQVDASPSHVTRGSSLADMTLSRRDSGQTGLLDAALQSSSSLVEAPTPEQQQQHGSGGGAPGSGPAETRKGGGLLGGRLWNAQHSRTHSFPLASSLTAALLQDQDSSGAVDVSGAGQTASGQTASPRKT